MAPDHSSAILPKRLDQSMSGLMSQNPARQRILIIDDDDVIRESLTQYLRFYHVSPYMLSVDGVSTIAEAEMLLQNQPYDLVLSDIYLPKSDGFAFSCWLREHYPRTKLALITAYNIEDYIRNAKKYGITNIIAKSAPFNFTELSGRINQLLQPEIHPGLINYLNKGTTIQETVIKNSEDIMEVFSILRHFMETLALANTNDISIAFIEALTNAVYHVPTLPDGSLKYHKGQHIEALDPSEYVYVQYGCDIERFGISVRDQGGKLNAQEVLHWLERNICGAGLLDTHGRGFYLMHKLVDRMMINIHEDDYTEIIMLNYFEPINTSNKPIYIQEF